MKVNIIPQRKNFNKKREGALGGKVKGSKDGVKAGSLNGIKFKLGENPLAAKEEDKKKKGRHCRIQEVKDPKRRPPGDRMNARNRPKTH